MDSGNCSRNSTNGNTSRNTNNEGSGDENGDVNRKAIVAKCVMKSITHPLDYARFLVQVSHNDVAVKLLFVCSCYFLFTDWS